MSISAGNWASLTDPFILALAHNYTSTVGEITYNRIKLLGSEGFINGIVDDKDVQEIFWSNDNDVEKSWPVTAFQTAGTGPAAGYPEFGSFQESIGTGFISFAPQDLIEADPKTAYAFTTGKSSGSVWYSLFAFSAYAWQQKDPAQLLFSWIAHWTSSIFDLKDYLDQTSFQDASDYYDENPCPLSCWREVGLSISDQIKKVMEHTADFLVIGPADTTGEVTLALKPRRSGLTERDTVIDLEGESIRSYTIRPTDRYTIDYLNIDFGSLIMMSGGPLADDSSDYITTPKIEFPSDNRNRSTQKVNHDGADRSVDVDCPYHTTRQTAQSHLDIGFWKDDQDEIELEFADPSHLNFEAGDIVHVTGRGRDGTEDYLVSEKIPDLDTLLATCRLLRVRGIAGKTPRYADTDNLIMWLRPNSLGMHFDGVTTFPKDIPVVGDPRNFDRWWSEAGYAHATEHTRGTVTPPGNPPELWPLTPDKQNGWPGFHCTTGYNGLEFSYDLTGGRNGINASSGNYTFYFAINISDVMDDHFLFESDDGGSNNLIISAAGPGTAGKLQYYDSGTWRGTQASITGWQILVFNLNTAGSIIRRNGVNLETGLAYTAISMNGLSDFGLGVSADGDSNPFNGHWMECALFSASHDTATMEAIEAHLAEKYDISI